MYRMLSTGESTCFLLKHLYTAHCSYLDYGILMLTSMVIDKHSDDDLITWTSFQPLFYNHMLHLNSVIALFLIYIFKNQVWDMLSQYRSEQGGKTKQTNKQTKSFRWVVNCFWTVVHRSSLILVWWKQIKNLGDCDMYTTPAIIAALKSRRY